MPEPDRRQRLAALIEQVSGQPAPADDEQSLFESGLLDSFALPDLVSAIEESFGVKVPDADRKFDSISRIQEYLEHHS